jgi:hypothetical protein
MNLEQQIRRITYLKPLVIGFLLGVGIMLLAGAGASANEAGPYQCREAGTNDMAIFVIDTRDGHIWRMSRGSCLDFGTPLQPLVEKGSAVPAVK